VQAIEAVAPSPATPWTAPADRLTVRATYLARRLDTRATARARRSARHPVVRRVGEGLAVLFPYGVVVTVGLGPVEEAELFAALAPHLTEPLDSPVTDEVVVSRREGRFTEGLDEEGVLWLSGLGEERLAVVADVLAKTAVLDHFEESIGRVLDRTQPLAEQMEQRGRTTRRARELVRLIGHSQVVRQETVWRVEVEEKPDLVWDRPELDRLWLRLADEYELGERHRALGRKVDLLSQSASTLLSLLHNEQSLRVEWYIVLLIVFEIVLTLFEMWAWH
jgi:uncharacterized Rmd1/YagE family protein